MQIDEVRALLQQFQDGYTQRDLEKVDEFMQLFVPEEDVEVIGTGAVKPGEDEWCLGQQQVHEIIENDWKYWGDLQLDVPGGRIFTRGEVAWLATSGTVTMTLDTEEAYQDYVDYMRGILDEENKTPEMKLLDILRGGANTLFELRRGETFVWPIRFSAVAVKQADRWRFHQMQFSFATTRFPDERLVSTDTTEG